MTNDEALRASVAENPADDLPRLVYADYCEETERPELAAFIRAEVELARLSEPRDRINRSAEIHQTLWPAAFNQLADTFKPAWPQLELHRGVDLQWILGPRAVVSRGFVGEVVCEWTAWDARAPVVVPFHPLTRVRFLTFPTGAVVPPGANYRAAPGGPIFTPRPCPVCSGAEVCHCGHGPEDHRHGGAAEHNFVPVPCTACGGARFLNEWDCPEWPRITFVFPLPRGDFAVEAGADINLGELVTTDDRGRAVPVRDGRGRFWARPPIMPRRADWFGWPLRLSPAPPTRRADEQSMNQPILVLYHGGGCRDGFTAAWLFRTAYSDAELVPVQHGEPPPSVNGRRVVLVDFCYPLEIVRDMLANAAELTILDHHKTALPIFDALFVLAGEAYERANDGNVTWAGRPAPHRTKLTLAYSAAKSGAELAWEHLCRVPTAEKSPAHRTFFPADWPAPNLVRYVADRDLWRWALPDSRDINAVIQTRPLEWAEWDHLHTVLSNPDGRASLAREGRIIRAVRAELTDAHVRNAGEIEIAGHRVPCVNATMLQSEIGERLCAGKPFAATWFERADGTRVWSLRSDANGLDVAEIAKKFGGGGHKHAAGFQTRGRPIVNLFSTGPGGCTQVVGPLADETPEDQGRRAVGVPPVDHAGDGPADDVLVFTYPRGDDAACNVAQAQTRRHPGTRTVVAPVDSGYAGPPVYWGRHPGEPVAPPAVFEAGEKLRLLDEAEQLRVQLAGCLTAAEGFVSDAQTAKQGDYGWSPAYAAVVELRRKFDRLSVSPPVLAGQSRWASWAGVLNGLAAEVHAANATWWHDPATGEPLTRNVGEMLMLAVSELAEAMEGHRKNRNDDHLPYRPMFEVELADTVIRILDLAAGLGLDLGGAFAEKMAYNAERADHKPEARLQPGGKRY